MKGSVANVAEKESLFVVGEAAVLAPLALLTLPARPNHRRDPDVCAGIEVVLATHRAEEKIFELFRRQFRHFPELPRLAIVVQVLRGAIDWEKK